MVQKGFFRQYIKQVLHIHKSFMWDRLHKDILTYALRNIIDLEHTYCSFELSQLHGYEAFLNHNVGEVKHLLSLHLPLWQSITPLNAGKFSSSVNNELSIFYEQYTLLQLYIYI